MSAGMLYYNRNFHGIYLLQRPPYLISFQDGRLNFVFRLSDCYMTGTDSSVLHRERLRFSVITHRIRFTRIIQLVLRIATKQDVHLPSHVSFKSCFVFIEQNIL